MCENSQDAVLRCCKTAEAAYGAKIQKISIQNLFGGGKRGLL